jgi:hypothetical protein
MVVRKALSTVLVYELLAALFVPDMVLHLYFLHALCVITEERETCSIMMTAAVSNSPQEPQRTAALQSLDMLSARWR